MPDALPQQKFLIKGTHSMYWQAPVPQQGHFRPILPHNLNLLEAQPNLHTHFGYNPRHILLNSKSHGSLESISHITGEH